MTTFATLRALHTLIGDALNEIQRVFREAPEGGGSLDYPALDVPFYKNGASSAAEDLSAHPTVVTAANTAVAACGQIAATLHKPFFQLCEAHMGEIMMSCIGFVEATHTVEILRAAGDGGLHVNDLTDRVNDLRRAVDANIVPLEPGKLSHILRLLATHHWFKEIRPDVFANNRLSAYIDSGKTPDQLRADPRKKYDDTDGVAALVSMKTDEFCKAAVSLTDQLLPERERSIATRTLLDGARSRQTKPDTGKYRTPFNLAFRTELGYYEWLELPENKRRMINFGRAMTAARAWEVNENIIDAFPWRDLPQDSVVVDVGGGIGQTSMVLARAYPHLHFIVQDRPKVVRSAPSFWDNSEAELIRSGRVSFTAQDFFDPQPTTLDVPRIGHVSAPAVYLIRGCVHNWPDDAVLRMLGHLRDRAAPTTQLLIVDTVLPYACVDEVDDAEQIPGALRTLVPAGSPLLANLGKANVSLYQLDICMMAVLDAKERTIREVSALARRAGWKVTGTTCGAGSLWGYTAATPIGG